MRPAPIYLFKRLNYLLVLLLLAGCTLEKESGFNRTMQNLTAHYNIIFNANEVLRQKQESVALGYIDNYGQILSVYQDTAVHTLGTTDKQLESVIVRGNTIISNKDQSHYVGDAYMLLGKANFMEYNYYNAIEFFNYAIRSFNKNKDLVQEARVWKARSLMHINQIAVADSLLDTAIANIFPKEKHTADVFASKLQCDIYNEKYPDAELMAAQAIKYTRDVNHRLRWTFILAQLQELDKKPADAINNYSKVVSSNAAFEMAFNASLNRIRIQDNQDGVKISRIDLLRKLLKDDKNLDFIDQIYFQIGELYAAQGNFTEAIKNYKLSIRNSTKNLNQKGLSYLRIADIDFRNRADYAGAKNYYDSTLTSLSPNYPGYQTIRKKRDNLQLLADRLQLIAREDTLQMLAKLNEKDRQVKIDQMVNRTLAERQAAAIAAKASPLNVQQPTLLSSGLNSNSNFYFYNTAAVAQGVNDFKRVWGNRPLTDNWRLSARSSADNNAAVSPVVQQLNATAAPNVQGSAAVNPAVVKMQQDIIVNIPFTPGQLTQSNNRIYNAYLDIANFYRDVLGDNKEAIAIFELLLKRFPNNINKPSVYYNLYRLYADVDKEKSDMYKNLVLKNYPETNFAKVISDPDYNRKINDKNAEFTSAYTDLFDLISHRKYGKADTMADDLITRYPTNPFLAQVYYLRTIALGHQQRLEPFRAELQEIMTKFPEDKLIVPLIKQHLAFINANEDELVARTIILTDTDPNEVPFMQKVRPIITKPYIASKPAEVKPKPALVTPKPVEAPKPVETPKPQTLTASNGVPGIAPTQLTAPANLPGLNLPHDTVVAKPPVVVEPPSIYSLSDSSNYFFVINVNSSKINLAPSRFGIGQFDRANFRDNSIKHQLKPVGDNQLIYVGRFTSLANVKAYARAIVPLLPEIMNVGADKYTVFIITQQNLDKMTDKKTLDSYFDFYQRKY